MTLSITPGSIVVTDTDGHVVLNTTEKLFYVTDPLIVATVSFPNRSLASDTSVVTNYTLGSCTSSSTIVRGAAAVTSSGSVGGGSAPVNTWINLSGTYVHSYTANVYQAYTVISSGGTVYVQEEIYAGAASLFPGGQYLDIVGPVMQFRILVGQFT